MPELKVELGNRGYQIVVEQGCLGRLGELIAPLGLGKRVFLITNTTVGYLYGEVAGNALRSAGFQVIYYEVEDGEEYKSLASAAQLYTVALKQEVDRSCGVVALGGGVIGDLAGFVASTYQRGIPYVQVPTTLLAQVDSSVGGKTAVNHPLGKNMIGTFYQPRLVVTDPQTLRSLPTRELRSGLAEVIKYGVIKDREFFDFLDRNLEQILALDYDLIREVILTSCAIKAAVVEQDEREVGLRAILNFGHTFGHPLETLTAYRTYRHGEAVAAGMVVAVTLAEEMGLLAPAERERLTGLLRRAGLPVTIPFLPEQIIELLPRDKKARHGKPRFVLPSQLGQVELRDDIDAELIASALDRCYDEGGMPG